MYEQSIPVFATSVVFEGSPDNSWEHFHVADSQKNRLLIAQEVNMPIFPALRRLRLCAVAMLCTLSLLPLPVSAQQPDVPALIAALHDPSLDVRITAAKALGQVDDYRVVGPLLGVQRDEQSPSVRMYASMALEQIRDPRAVDPLLAELAADNYLTRVETIRTLGRFHDPRIAGRLAAIMTKHADSEARQAAAFALGELRDARAVEPLLVLLTAQIPGNRALAAQLLGMIGDARAVEPLLADLQRRDEIDVVWDRAITSLGQIGDARAANGLIAVLATPTRAREEAIDALVALGQPAVPALSTALADTNPKIRSGAAWVLGRIGDNRALEPLLGALQDTDISTRYRVVDSLGQFSDQPRIVAPLIAVLRQTQPVVRNPAVEACREEDAHGLIDRMEPMEPEVDSISVRIRAAQVLGKTDDPRAVAALTGVLTDEDKWVRQAAAQALRDMSCRGAVPQLLPLLNADDRETRSLVVDVLGKDNVLDHEVSTALAQGYRSLWREFQQSVSSLVTVWNGTRARPFFCARSMPCRLPKSGRALAPFQTVTKLDTDCCSKNPASRQARRIDPMAFAARSRLPRSSTRNSGRYMKRTASHRLLDSSDAGSSSRSRKAAGSPAGPARRQCRSQWVVCREHRD